MSDVPSHLDLLRDPRLATHATSATPVWLWGADATRILWANSVGAAIFGSETPAALIGRRFDPHDPAAAQIGRLAGSLPQGGPGRLERLRGFGTGFWRMLLCSCARISLPDHTTGILVVALEPAGPALSLAERVRRLYDGAAGRGTGRAATLRAATGRSSAGCSDGFDVPVAAPAASAGRRGHADTAAAARRSASRSPSPPAFRVADECR